MQAADVSMTSSALTPSTRRRGGLFCKSNQNYKTLIDTMVQTFVFLTKTILDTKMKSFRMQRTTPFSLSMCLFAGR